MANPKPDALSMFEPLGGNIMSGEDFAQNDQQVGVSARDAIMIAVHPQRMVKLVDIIEDSPVQFRVKPFDPETNEKDRSIFETMGDPNIGLIQPITLQEIKGTGTGLLGVGKKYRVVCGHRRRASALLHGWEYIQAIIMKSHEDIVPITFSENSGVEDLTQYERAMQLKKAKEIYPGIFQKDLAIKVSMQLSYVNQLLNALDSSEELLSLFINGMPVKTVLALRPVFDATDEFEHKNLAERLTDCTQAKAESLAYSVNKNIDPIVAIEMHDISPRKVSAIKPVFEVPISDNADSDSAEASKDSQKYSSTLKRMKPVETVQNAISAPSLWSGVVNEPEYTIPQAEETGTSVEFVGKLIHEAKYRNLNLKEFDQMCVISGVIGDNKLAYDHLMILQADPRIYRLFEKYCEIAKTVARMISKIEKSGNANLATSLRAVVFNPLPLEKVEKGKKKLAAKRRHP